MECGIRGENAVAFFLAVLGEICGDIGYVVVLNEYLV
jgi:hypothetical protein